MKSIYLEEGKSLLAHCLAFLHLEVLLVSCGKVEGGVFNKIWMTFVVKAVAFESVDDVEKFLFWPNLFYACRNFLVTSWCFLHVFERLLVRFLFLFNLSSHLFYLSCIIKGLPWEMQSSVLKTSRFFWSKVKISASNCAWINDRIHFVCNEWEPLAEQARWGFYCWTLVPG